MSHDKLSTNTGNLSSPCHHLELQAWLVQFEVAVLHSWDWRRFWHLFSSLENTCLSIQSLVLTVTFRCHFFVSHSAYPSFTPVMARHSLSFTAVNYTWLLRVLASGSLGNGIYCRRRRSCATPPLRAAVMFHLMFAYRYLFVRFCSDV
jgi:hypothetical protein